LAFRRKIMKGVKTGGVTVGDRKGKAHRWVGRDDLRSEVEEAVQGWCVCGDGESLGVHISWQEPNL
jgi:hypothetical protein